jgi:hypothetical protein
MECRNIGKIFEALLARIFMELVCTYGRTDGCRLVTSTCMPSSVTFGSDIIWFTLFDFFQTGYAGRERNARHYWEVFKRPIQDVYGIAVEEGR